MLKQHGNAHRRTSHRLHPLGIPFVIALLFWLLETGTNITGGLLGETAFRVPWISLPLNLLLGCLLYAGAFAAVSIASRLGRLRRLLRIERGHRFHLHTWAGALTGAGFFLLYLAVPLRKNLGAELEGWLLANGTLFLAGLLGLSVLSALLFRWALLRLQAAKPAVRWALSAALPALLGLVALYGFTTSGSQPFPEARATRSAPAGAPNVLLLTLDTTRADRLGCYGHDRARTPAMDRLASEGVLFEKAYAQSPWTKASFGSIMTGRYPAEHGAVCLRDGENRTVFDGSIRKSIPTLAERLLDLGYHTYAYVTNLWSSDQYGFQRGFEFFAFRSLLCDLQASQMVFGMFLGDKRGEWIGWEAYPDAEAVYGHFESWLEHWRAQRSSAPFFLWVQLMDAHGPYHLREAYTDRNSPYQTVHTHEIRPGNLEHFENLYDSEIAYMDHAIGRMLDALERQGLLDSTAVVLTADHGEEFAEHGDIGRVHRPGELPDPYERGYDHGHTMHAELLHVPLILRHPDSLPAGTRKADMVRLVDLYPTILELAGATVPEPDDRWSGQSLVAYAQGAGTPPPGLAVAENFSFGPQADALIRYPYKLVYRPFDERLELYDLSRDPGEQEDLSRTEPGVASELLETLAARMAEREEEFARIRSGEYQSAQGLQLDAADLDRLRSLGYIQ